MKTMDKVYIPPHEHVNPTVYDTYWFLLAWHTQRAGTTNEMTTLWLWNRDDKARYCTIDKVYVQLQN